MPALAIAASVGTLIQAFFSWTGYNRDSFGLNVGWRQNQLHQTKNYHLSWVTFAREDLRAMKEVSVHHTSNYLMVATMFMSSTVLVLGIAGFSGDCPSFVVSAFYTSGISAVVFLMLGIIFGIKSQGAAYEQTVSMLTNRIRPFNPQENGFNYMAQAQTMERPTSLFRLPALSDTSYDCEARAKMAKMASGNEKEATTTAVSGAPPPAPCTPPPPTVLEEMCTSTAATYLSSFEELLDVWKPYEEFCKICMGLGTIGFTQTAAYFTVGKVVSLTNVYQVGHLSLTLSAGFLFLMLAILGVYRPVAPVIKVVLGVLLAYSFTAISIASATPHHSVMHVVLVPSAFMSHVLFWVVLYCVLRAYLDTMDECHSHRGEEPSLEAQVESPPLSSCSGVPSDKEFFTLQD
jgi:hypothetical protein